MLVLHYVYLYLTWPWILETFPENLSSGTASVSTYIQEEGWLIAGPMLLLTMLLEEQLFRLLPLGITAFFLVKLGLIYKPVGLAVLLLVALLSSVAFGLIHGNVGNIFIQGFAGVLLSITFLKWGKLGLEPVSGLFAAFALHTANNLGIYMLQFIL